MEDQKKLEEQLEKLEEQLGDRKKKIQIQLDKLNNPVQQSLAKEFSYLIEWKNDDTGKFQVGKRKISLYLLRKVVNVFQHNDATEKKYWILYWHKDWLKFYEKNKDESFKNKNRILSHPLDAYCQRYILNAAKKIDKKLEDIPFYKNAYSIEDYFYIGNTILWTKILLTYNPEINSNLAAHVSGIVYKRIWDYFRKQTKIKGESPLNIFINAAKKNRKEALILFGIGEKDLDNYLLVWEYFKEIGNNRKQDLLEGIELKEVIEILAPNIFESIQIETEESIQINSKEEIKKYLKICSKALFGYLNRINSANTLDAPISPGEKETTFVDILEDPDSTNKLLTEEEKKRAYKLNKVYLQVRSHLRNVINGLKAEATTNEKLKLFPEFELIIKMLYEMNFTQTQIVKYINLYYPELVNKIVPNPEKGLSQFHISRLKTKIDKILRQRFFNWLTTTSTIKGILNTSSIKGILNINSDVLKYLGKDEKAIKKLYKSESIKKENFYKVLEMFENFEQISILFYKCQRSEIFVSIKNKIQNLDREELEILKAYYYDGDPQIKVEYLPQEEQNISKAYKNRMNNTYDNQYPQINIEKLAAVCKILVIDPETVDLASKLNDIQDDFTNQLIEDSRERLEYRLFDGERELTKNLIDKWLEYYYNNLI